MISASHNPFADNGIKIFGPDGFKLPDKEEAEIEALLADSKLDVLGKTGSSVGRAERLDDAIGRYIVYAKSTFPRELTLDGLRVVVDAAHGAAYRVAPAVFHTWSVQPMLEQFGVAILEEGGDTPIKDLPPRPTQVKAREGSDPYARRTQRLARQWEGVESARLITRFEDVRGVVTKRGARSMFLVDKSIGYHTAGLSVVMHELAPGKYQSRHRHGGEAWLYAVSGSGYSTLDDVRHDWEAGDLIVVDHWAWHQHFNSAGDKTARLIRIHNFDALYDMMRVLMDPLSLFEEPPKLDAPDLTGIEWPDHLEGRPEA